MSEDELNRTLTGVAAGESALSSGLATHMKNILAKLHLENRAQVVAYDIRTGVLNVSAFEAP